MKVLVHEMKYFGEKVSSDLNLANYNGVFYDEYRRIVCECFHDLRLATNLDPDTYYTPEEMNEKKPNVFILLENNEIVGSVQLCENILDVLFVNPKYQNKGYGKKLLHYAINRMQEAEIEDITLYVADLNTKAIQLYLNNGFKCTKSIWDNWGE
jgi:ribosomal protein S18 acetylase RimI-like enzyme